MGAPGQQLLPRAVVKRGLSPHRALSWGLGRQHPGRRRCCLQPPLLLARDLGHAAQTADGGEGFASLQQGRRGDPPVLPPRSRLVTLEMALCLPRREGLCAAAPQQTLVQSGLAGRAAAALNGCLCSLKNARPQLATRHPPPSADPFSSHATVGGRRRSKRWCWRGICAGACPAAGMVALRGG